MIEHHLLQGFAAVTFWVAGVGFALGLTGFLGIAWWRGWLNGGSVKSAELGGMIKKNRSPNISASTVGAITLFNPGPREIGSNIDARNPKAITAFSRLRLENRRLRRRNALLLAGFVVGAALGGLAAWLAPAGWLPL